MFSEIRRSSESTTGVHAESQRLNDGRICGHQKGTHMTPNKRSIKWRITAPAYRAAAVGGTVVALIAATGAPWKWR